MHMSRHHDHIRIGNVLILVLTDLFKGPIVTHMSCQTISDEDDQLIGLRDHRYSYV